MTPLPILPPNPEIDTPLTSQLESPQDSISSPHAQPPPSAVAPGGKDIPMESDNGRTERWIKAGVLEPPPPPPPPVPLGERWWKGEPQSRALAPHTRLELAVGPWYPVAEPSRTRLSPDLTYWGNFLWSPSPPHHFWGVGFVAWNGVATVETPGPYGTRDPLVAQAATLSLGAHYTFLGDIQKGGWRWSQGVGVYPIRWTRSLHHPAATPPFHSEARNRRSWDPLAVHGHGALWWGIGGRLEVGLWGRLAGSWPPQMRASWGLALATSLPGQSLSPEGGAHQKNFQPP